MNISYIQILCVCISQTGPELMLFEDVAYVVKCTGAFGVQTQHKTQGLNYAKGSWKFYTDFVTLCCSTNQ